MPIMRRLYIFGTGAHARKVAHYARLLNWDIIGFVDETPNSPAPISGYSVITPNELGQVGKNADAAFVAIGAPTVRRRLMNMLDDKTWPQPPIIHPNAWVAPDVVIENGVLVAAGAIVETGTFVSRGAIVDVGVVLDHDVHIGEFVHLRAGTVCETRSVILLSEVIPQDKHLT